MKAFWIYTSDKAKESLVSDVCWIGENIRNTSVSFDSFLSVQLYGPKYIYIAMQTSPPSTSWTFPCSPIPTKHQLPIPFLPAFGNHHYILCLNEFDYCAAAAAKSLQSCPTLCDPVDGSPPGSPVPGILQARRVGCHFLHQWVEVKGESEVAQSCPTLRDPMDCSLPGSPVHGIFQARVLEWGAIAFSVDYSR